MAEAMRCSAILAGLISVLVASLPASAQEQVVRPDTMPVADTIPTELPNPRGAFIRAALVPGWGHAYTGSYTRGGVYLSLQTTSWVMLGKTIHRLNEVKDRDARLTALATDSLAILMAEDTALARILSDPARYNEALLQYPGLENARNLVSARKQQRQDWITYTLFFTFAAAVDAYVTAHLKDFPGEITATPMTGGGMQLQVGIPLGGRR